MIKLIKYKNNSLNFLLAQNLTSEFLSLPN
jgi:hypothetical protein